MTEEQLMAGQIDVLKEKNIRLDERNKYLEQEIAELKAKNQLLEERLYALIKGVALQPKEGSRGSGADTLKKRDKKLDIVYQKTR